MRGSYTPAHGGPFRHLFPGNLWCYFRAVGGHVSKLALRQRRYFSAYLFVRFAVGASVRFRMTAAQVWRTRIPDTFQVLVRRKPVIYVTEGFSELPNVFAASECVAEVVRRVVTWLGRSRGRKALIRAVRLAFRRSRLTWCRLLCRRKVFATRTLFGCYRHVTVAWQRER